MSAISNLFLNRTVVKNHQGNYINLPTYFKGMKVGLLFSAAWCKPCTKMTPEIIKYYENNNGGKDFEIIYISGDVDEMQFQKYYSKMPWFALDFDETAMIVRYLYSFFLIYFVYIQNTA